LIENFGSWCWDLDSGKAIDNLGAHSLDRAQGLLYRRIMAYFFVGVYNQLVLVAGALEERSTVLGSCPGFSTVLSPVR
jgi:hypothetical protein